MIIMTTQITAGENAGTVPVACALTPADLVAQRHRWERLIGRAMTERAEAADGLRLAFRPAPGVEEELREIVAVENECCPWATWTIEANSGRVVLDVCSAAAGIAVLHRMFTGLSPGA
jgi:hypothetical protein